VERSRRLIAGADVILYVIDGSRGLVPEDRVFLQEHEEEKGPARLIPLWNKADLAPAPPAAASAFPGLLGVSARTGEGLSALLARLGAVRKNPGEGLALGNERQKERIEAARDALAEALGLTGEPLDLIAPLLREAVDALGEITGETASPDILETMFSRFCVGK